MSEGRETVSLEEFREKHWTPFGCPVRDCDRWFQTLGEKKQHIKNEHPGGRSWAGRSSSAACTTTA